MLWIGLFFYCCNTINEARYFIKKRCIFGSQFLKFKSTVLALICYCEDLKVSHGESACGGSHHMAKQEARDWRNTVLLFYDNLLS
jgi:hypothetical protein